MKSKEYFDDLTQIRTMMERSTKFLSLAGWSGILVGVFGLLAAVAAMQIIQDLGSGALISYDLADKKTSNLILLTLGTLVISLATIIWFSWRKSSQKGEPVWNAAARRLVFNMAVPLAAGGLLSLILWVQGAAGLIPAVMLLFYGMAMFSAGNFTFGEVRYLGMIEMVLGLGAAYFTGFSIIFWAMGFGVMHIVYGIYLYVRYEK